MEILNTIQKRRSIRGYSDEKVSEDKLKKILEAAWAAPVGMNDYQSLHLTVIQDKVLLGELSEAAAALYRKPGVDFYYGAPLVILVSSKENKHLPHIEYSNAGCLIQNMMLMATELELGSVYIFGNLMALAGNKELLNKLEIPEGYKPISAVAIGRTAVLPHEKALGETIGVTYL